MSVAASPFFVRRATPADLPEVSQLAAALVRQHHAYDARRFMLVEPVASGYAWWLGKELERAEAVVLVAREGQPGREGDVIGYSYGTLEPRDWNQLLDEAGWLHDIFVSPAARRRGVARALATTMMTALRELGAPRVLISSAWPNREAQALFESLGFRRTMVEMTRELDE